MVEVEHDVPFRNANTDIVQRFRQRCLCNTLCLSNLFDLLRRFHRAAVIDGTAQHVAPIQLHLFFQRTLKHSEIMQRHGHGLHCCRLCAILPQQLLNLKHQVNDTAICHALPCLFNIPEVDDEIGNLTKAYHRSGGGEHSGEIAPVDIGLDDGAVNSGRQQPHQLLNWI